MIIPGREANVLSRETNDCFFHYNILRPASFVRRRDKGTGESGMVGTRSDVGRFVDDPKWLELVAMEAPKKAIVLVTDRATIVQRVKERVIREKQSAHAQERPYNPARWLELLDKIDVDELYQAWCAELQRHDIPQVLIDSTDQNYRALKHIS